MFRRSHASRDYDSAAARDPTVNLIREMLIDSNQFVVMLETNNVPGAHSLRLTQSRLETRDRNRLNSFFRRRFTRDRSQGVRANTAAHLEHARNLSQLLVAPDPETPTDRQ